MRAICSKKLSVLTERISIVADELEGAITQAGQCGNIVASPAAPAGLNGFFYTGSAKLLGIQFAGIWWIKPIILIHPDTASVTGEFQIGEFWLFLLHYVTKNDSIRLSIHGQGGRN